MKPKLLITGTELTPKSISINYGYKRGFDYLDMDFNIQLTSSGDFSKYFIDGKFSREKLINDLFEGDIRIVGKKQV